jgi:GH35 family endo-1,4-beta-xylanase
MVALRALLLAAPALALLAPRTPSELLAEYGAPVPLPRPRYLARNASAPTTLRAAAAARGLAIGAAINQALYTSASEPQYAATFLQEFSLATCENGCKCAETEPEQGTFDFSECSFIADAALNAGKGAFRGHNFVWGPYNPSWVSSALGPAGLKQAMATHIGTLLAHYAADASLPPFKCWDVVNEAVCDPGSSQYNCSHGALWKDVVWSPSGEGTAGGYVENAFRFAQAANTQKLKLFYNDYSAEAAGGTKSDKVYAMLQDMLARGVPITGVGLQVRQRAAVKGGALLGSAALSLSLSLSLTHTLLPPPLFRADARLRGRLPKSLAGGRQHQAPRGAGAGGAHHRDGRVVQGLHG